MSSLKIIEKEYDEFIKPFKNWIEGLEIKDEDGIARVIFPNFKEYPNKKQVHSLRVVVNELIKRYDEEIIKESKDDYYNERKKLINDIIGEIDKYLNSKYQYPHIEGLRDWYFLIRDFVVLQRELRGKPELSVNQSKPKEMPDFEKRLLHIEPDTEGVNMTDKQRKIINFAVQHPEMNPTRIGRELGESQQIVSETMKKFGIKK